MIVILLIILISFKLRHPVVSHAPQAEILLRRSTPQQPIAAGSRRCYGRHDRSLRCSTHPIGAKAFMNAWSKAGPAQHCVIGVGNIADKIAKFGSLTGIETARVC